MKIITCDKCGKQLSVDRCTLRTHKAEFTSLYSSEWNEKDLDLCVPCFHVVVTLLGEALAAKQIETGVCHPPDTPSVNEKG